ncbi:NADP-dependent oxidoreductase [Nocardia sp. BMG111209]|uniref:NADP-dependent oxidoreductase n=1 Tax=Nocardia sp. BMG111209 TaxID=1160137 RepID=UPI000366511F|nr:NADP-dependent oxidoreductase [Nocardia sp. BMG111209]
MTTTHTVLLAARPDGLPDPATFRLVEHSIPEPAAGQVLIRNLYMSLDPGMLMLIGDYPGIPMPPYMIGEPLTGDTVGEVVASRVPSVPVGALVRHRLGWREHAVATSAEVRVVPHDRFPSPSGHLGFGLVAYAGLTAVAGMRPGDTVYVSSAAGATGSLAGQIARLLGAGRVVGSVGSAAKVAHARDVLGYDAVFDYHDGLLPNLRAAAPAGIDVYFDLVGGDHLRAAIEVMNPGGRIALCGALTRQHAGGTPDGGPGDLLPVIGKRLTLRGFSAFDHLDLAPEYEALLRNWLADGAIVQHETVIDGLAQAPGALLDLVRGRHLGKTVVRLTR